MRALEDKLKKEGKTGTRIVSYVFPFPTLKPVARKSGVYLYKI